MTRPETNGGIPQRVSDYATGPHFLQAPPVPPPNWRAIGFVLTVIGLLIGLGGVIWAASDRLGEKASVVSVSAVEERLRDTEKKLAATSEAIETIKATLEKQDRKLGQIAEDVAAIARPHRRRGE